MLCSDDKETVVTDNRVIVARTTANCDGMPARSSPWLSNERDGLFAFGENA